MAIPLPPAVCNARRLIRTRNSLKGDLPACSGYTVTADRGHDLRCPAAAGRSHLPLGWYTTYHFRTGFSVSHVPLNPAGITNPSPIPYTSTFPS